MTDIDPVAALTIVAEVFRSYEDSDFIAEHGDGGSRIYTDLATAKACTAFDYTKTLAATGAVMGDEGVVAGVLSWKNNDDCHWELFDDGKPSGMFIDLQAVYSPAGVAVASPTTGAEGVGVRP